MTTMVFPEPNRKDNNFTMKACKQRCTPTHQKFDINGVCSNFTMKTCKQRWTPTHQKFDINGARSTNSLFGTNYMLELISTTSVE
jgi:hypothetical protein